MRTSLVCMGGVVLSLIGLGCGGDQFETTPDDSQETGGRGGDGAVEEAMPARVASTALAARVARAAPVSRRATPRATRRRRRA